MGKKLKKIVKLKSEKGIANKNLRVLLTIIVILLFFYFIYYYEEIYKPSERITTESPSIIKPERKIPKETTPIKPITEYPTQVKEKEVPTTVISNLKCVDGTIMMTFTNILDKPLNISDFIFHVSGLLNRNPECDLQELQPKESTFCRKINPIKFNKDVLVTISYSKGTTITENQVVDCSKESKITTNIVADIGYWLLDFFS